MLSRIHYWSTTKSGPKSFVVITKDEDIEIDTSKLTWKKTYDSVKAKDVLGICTLIPANNEWSFEFVGPRFSIREDHFTNWQAAKTAMLTKREEVFAEENQIQASPELLLTRCLKEHDWYYDQSDDSRVFWAGEKSAKDIQKLISKMDKKKAREIWKQHAPKESQCPV